METGEPPERRDIVQHKGKLVAAEEDVQRILMIEAVIENQSDIVVFLDDCLLCTAGQ